MSRRQAVWLIVPLFVAAHLAGCRRPRDWHGAPITITYWTRSWWGDPAQYQGENPIPVPDWQKQQIAKFEAAHPGVKVDLQIDPGGRGDKIRLAFAGGVPPDLFHGGPDTEFIKWAALGFLEPIDPYLGEDDRADIFPAALATCSYDGKHYAWPLYNHALCVVINRDLFRARALTDRIPGPDAVWTMDELRELARKLTFDRDGDGRTDVYGVGLHCLDTNHVFLTAYLINFGARVFDGSGRFVLDSNEGVAGMRFLRGLIDERVATPGAAGYKYDDIRSLFADQRIAMYLSSAGILIWAEDQARKGTIKRFDWGLVPVPSQPGVKPTSYLTVGAVFVARQRDAKRRDACMALAKFITGPEPNRFFWRVASPRRSSPPPIDPNLAIMMQQIDRADNFMLPPQRLPDRLNLSEEMVRLYQDVLSQPPKATPEEALHGLAGRLNRMIEGGS